MSVSQRFIVKQSRTTFTNEQVIWKKALYLQSHPFGFFFVGGFFFFTLRSIIYIAKASIMLFKLKHLAI